MSQTRPMPDHGGDDAADDPVGDAPDSDAVYDQPDAWADDNDE